MGHVKAVIFGVRNVLVRDANCNSSAMPDHLDDVINLINYLIGKKIKCIILSNHSWVIKNEDGTTTDVRSILAELMPGIHSHFQFDEKSPAKQNQKFGEELCKKYDFSPNEVLYVGNTDTDMQSALNNHFLFCNAEWYGSTVKYGIKFSLPVDVARFIDVFGFRQHLWSFEYEDSDIEFYSLAPYGWLGLNRNNKFYCMHAKHSKYNAADADFWCKYVLSTIFFQGLLSKFDYLTVYPKHTAGHGNAMMDGHLRDFGGAIRKAYLEDLLIRNMNVKSSSSERVARREPSIDTQLGSVTLNRFPLKPFEQVPYKTKPVTRGKTVLVLDDICTAGHAFETARFLIEGQGAKVILVSWLKTVNTNYQKMVFRGGKRSFIEIPYSRMKNQHQANVELDKQLKLYTEWNWT